MKQVYRIGKSNDHGAVSRRNPFDHARLSNKETRDVKKELDEIDKKFDRARGVKCKYVQKEHDTIKDDIEVEIEPNVYEPFDEYIKQV